SGAIVHPSEHTVQAVASTYERVRWQVLDERIRGDLAGLAAADDGELEIISRSDDDRTWLVVFLGDDRAPRFYLWDRQQATYLFSARKDLDGLPLARMQPVIIPARDGLPLVSYLTRPVGQTAPSSL